MSRPLREADHDLLEEIRQNRIYANDEWGPMRDEARIDRLCVGGKPWQALDPEAVKERRSAKRPFLASDELGQYINQTVNDVRANPRGIKYAPTGNGANDKGAEFYQNHVREIEYRSHASRVAYPTPFEHAVIGGYGWLRIRAKRQHIRTFDQDLSIEAVVNSDQVLSDPKAVWPDSRDMKFLLYLEPWARQEFKRQFPRAKAASFSLETSRLAPGWITRDIVNVGEYWRLTTYTRKLVAYQPLASDDDPDPDPVTSLVDELPDGKLPEGVENLREEDVDDSRVEWFLTNGLEVLGEKHEWKGKYIPFVSCFGKILYVDEGAGPKRHLISMTRLARDPYMLLCYMITCKAEAVGGIPRASFIGYEGQFAKPDRWAKSNRVPVSHLEAKASVPGAPPGAVLPLPQKQPWDPPLQNLEMAIQASRQAIQAAMGISPQPTEVQRRNDISGEAWKQRQAQSQKGSFHFVDHYDLMIERVGMLLEDLITPILDTARDVPVRKPDDSAAVVRINDPNGSVLRNGQYSEDPIFTKGDYRVTISTGPSNESQRQEAQDFVDSIISNLGAIAQIAGAPIALKLFAKSVRLKQLGPIGDDIIALVDPPQLGQDGKPLPPEVAQLLSQNQQLKQMVQQAQQALEADYGKHRATIEGKQIDTDKELALQVMKDATSMEVARINAAAKGQQVAMELDEERLAVGLEAARHAAQLRYDATQAGAERVHASGESARDRIHERLQATTEHQHALEIADKAHQQNLELAATGAANESAQSDQEHQQNLETIATTPPSGGEASA